MSVEKPNSKEIIPGINIIVAGYGHLGSKLVDYLNGKDGLHISSIIEPDQKKRHQIVGIKAYPTINEAPIFNVGLIVDCSTRGEGEKNKPVYEELNLPAVFQNGESMNIGTLYYPGLFQGNPDPYMRIPCCSAISVIRIIDALTRAGFDKPKRVVSFNVKTTNDKLVPMVSADYISGKEIKALTGINAKTDRIYLPGQPYNGDYVYAGNVQLNFKDMCQQKEVILAALEQGEGISLTPETIDTRMYPRTTDTVIIKESIDIDPEFGILAVSLLSFPPEIDFPINLAIIKDHAKVRLLNKVYDE